MEPVRSKFLMGTGIQITTEHKRHLGAAIGSRSFAEEYMNNGVRKSSALPKLQFHNLTPPMWPSHMAH